MAALVQPVANRGNSLKILIMNDDGFYAAGLTTLINVLKTAHDLYVCAPKAHMSGMGHAISVGQKIRVEKQAIDGVKAAYTVDGTPSDCSKIAHLYLFKDIDFDLVISGINCGLNLAVDVIYSGTASAAHESWAYGYNALALSQDIANNADDTNFQAAAEHAKALIAQLDFNDKPFLYSINYPANRIPKGLLYAEPSNVVYHEAIDIAGDDTDFTIKLTGQRNNLSANNDNEYDLVKKGYAVIYPLQIEVTPKRRNLELLALVNKLKD